MEFLLTSRKQSFNALLQISMVLPYLPLRLDRDYNMQGVQWKIPVAKEPSEHDKYESLRDLDNDSSETITSIGDESSTEWTRSKRALFGGISLFLLILLISGAAGLQWKREVMTKIHWEEVRLDPQAPPRVPLSCGNSTTEAKARGCVFDVLACNWLHKDCPRDYNDDFYYYQNGTPWAYYRDQKGTYKMTLEELSHNSYYWSSKREHLVHCSFMLKRGYDVMARGGRLDNLVGSHEYSSHCAEYLREHLGIADDVLDEIHTYGSIGFLTC